MQKIIGLGFAVFGFLLLKETLTFQEQLGLMFVVLGWVGMFYHDHAT